MGSESALFSQRVNSKTNEPIKTRTAQFGFTDWAWKWHFYFYQYTCNGIDGKA